MNFRAIYGFFSEAASQLNGMDGRYVRLTWRGGQIPRCKPTFLVQLREWRMLSLVAFAVCKWMWDQEDAVCAWAYIELGPYLLAKNMARPENRCGKHGILVLLFGFGRSHADYRYIRYSRVSKVVSFYFGSLTFLLCIFRLLLYGIPGISVISWNLGILISENQCMKEIIKRNLLVWKKTNF